MNHRLIAYLLGLGIVLTIVGGGVYWQRLGTGLESRIGPPPAEAAPPITWTPSSLNEVVGQGQTKTVTASFTSSANLRDVVVRVVPELQPYVQVSPASFPTIAKGQTLSINVTFSASSTAPLGTATGAIQLRSGKGAPKTFARPLPVRVEVWNGYFDSAGGYTVAFPPNLIAEVIDNALILAADPDTGEETPHLRFTTDANPTGLAPQDYYDGEPGRDLVGQCEGTFSELTVGGVVALKCIPVISFSGETVIIVPRPGVFVRIDDIGGGFEASGLLGMILGTIHF